MRPFAKTEANSIHATVFEMNIAEYIEQDLEAKICTDEEIPCKLTLGALAHHYDVSPTPVRQALQKLIERKVIVRMDNGRLKIGEVKKTRKQVKAPEKPTDWEFVLAQEILLLSLRGESVFLREEAMAEQHGIGRTLLRRVFNRLSGGGLLRHVPRRGWQVETFRKKDMEAFVDIREVLELRALDLSQDVLSNSQLQEILDGNSEEAVARKQIDNSLHQYFVRCSGNRYIESFFEVHGGYYMALFDYATLGVEVVSEMAAQHREILQHAMDRRWDQARKSLANHIQAQRPIMQEMIEKIGGQLT